MSLFKKVIDKQKESEFLLDAKRIFSDTKEKCSVLNEYLDSLKEIYENNQMISNEIFDNIITLLQLIDYNKFTLQQKYYLLIDNQTREDEHVVIENMLEDLKQTFNMICEDFISNNYKDVSIITIKHEMRRVFDFERYKFYLNVKNNNSETKSC